MTHSVTRKFCLLGLAAGVFANPLPTPPPFTPPTDGAGALASPTCTTVLTSTITGFHGDFTPEVAHTVYTKTVTEHSRVDCNGCALSITTQLASFWGGFGPQEIITATVTAKDASTTTLTVCRDYGKPPTHGQIPRAEGPGDCTYTKVIIPSPHAVTEGDRTVYTATATTTSHIDCAGCNFLAVSTADPFHPGPMVQYTSTVTASTPTAATSYVCLKSPSVVLPPSSSHSTRPAAPTGIPSGVMVVTVTETLTRTVFAATSTVATTVTCSPGHRWTSQGAIPRHLEHSTTSPNPGAETIYETEVVSTSATWTWTSFHCAQSTKTSTSAPGTGKGGGIAEREVGGPTKPPPRPTLTATPSGTTITINFPTSR